MKKRRNLPAGIEIPTPLDTGIKGYFVSKIEFKSLYMQMAKDGGFRHQPKMSCVKQKELEGEVLSPT